MWAKLLKFRNNLVQSRTFQIRWWFACEKGSGDAEAIRNFVCFDRRFSTIMSPHAQYKTSNTELGAAKMGRGNKEKRKQDNALLDSMTQTLRQMIKSGEQNFTINGKSYNVPNVILNISSFKTHADHVI